MGFMKKSQMHKMKEIIVIIKNKLYIVNLKLKSSQTVFLWDTFPQTSENENEWL